MAKDGTEPTDAFIFLHEEGNDNHQSRHNYKKKHEEITQTMKRIMYITDTMAYTYITARSLV